MVESLSTVKLIASDMDGTLLDSASRVPEETFDLIRELNRVGVRFAVASGRRFDTLWDYFEPVAGMVDFVASNGAQVVVDGQLIDREVYSYASLQRLFEVVQMFDSLHLAVFDRTSSYLLDDPDCFQSEFDKDLPNPVRVRELPPASTSIIKASVFCDDSVMDMAYALGRELSEDFVFAPSGSRWIDAMQRGVNKATGIRQVMRMRGVEPQEVMAFGDAMNDYEILRMVGQSCAMGNARSAIKQIAGRTIGTNEEHAVQAQMRAVLESLTRR